MDDLKRLKAELIAAREAFETIGRANVSGMTLDEQVEIDISYRRAMQRYHDACDAYNRAIGEMI